MATIEIKSAIEGVVVYVLPRSEAVGNRRSLIVMLIRLAIVMSICRSVFVERKIGGKCKENMRNFPAWKMFQMSRGGGCTVTVAPPFLCLYSYYILNRTRRVWYVCLPII